ncbi:hypothetical protein UK23_25465 [Lentzea aerocolonigenes]|uniref:Peptidase C39-like domain-containing protein n=1 Tax=Lentzea aerocolonigenes TaxID=68170 RepID=A0A0F0GW68_LENAE|nr:hypothetical protein [Lentzea aerocolonigenes]KJK45668.1 hypothetical protein UK23_25465 [Lentzea aerocolonigenes]
MIRNALIAAAATATLATAFAPMASADIIGTPAPCVTASDLTGPDFTVRKCGVSDVDQFRTDLDNNGNAYCGPASLYNVLHYWGHVKGAPVGWGPTKVGWIDPMKASDYDLVTGSIYRIGADAKYNGSTNLTNLRTAWDSATKLARDAGWQTSRGVVSTLDSTDFAGDVARKLNEGPLQLVYGRYKNGPLSDTLQRTGGHIVTVVSATGSFGGNTIKLKLADPGRAGDHGDGDYLNTQSAYEALDVTLTKRHFLQYSPASDDKNTAEDESQEPGTYTWVDRWELTGPRYLSDTTRQMVEGFNWFDMAK